MNCKQLVFLAAALLLVRVDAVEVGAAVKCTIDPTGNSHHTVYRFMEDETLRGYPTPPIADSWDPDWRTTIVRIADCSDIAFGPALGYKAVTLEVGAAVKCTIDPTGNDHRTVYRVMEDETLRGYPSEEVADCWDDDWRTTLIQIADCSDKVFGAKLSCSQTNAQTNECTASFWGDPHMNTFDGLKFDAQPFGEAIFLRQTTTQLEIQGRLEPWFSDRSWSPAVTTAVAFHGPTDDEPIIHVSMTSDSNEATTSINGCHVKLFVDGIVQETFFHDTYDEGGALVMQETNFISIEYADVIVTELSVDVAKGKCFFSGDVTLLDCESAQDNVIGLLGSPNGNAGDDWMDQEGNPLTIPSGASDFFFQPAFEYTLDNWMNNDPSESLFTFKEGESFEDYTDPNQEYDPEYEQSILEGGGNEQLQELCNGDIGCLIDGTSMGIEAAQEYLNNPAAGRAPTSTARSGDLDFGDDDLLCLDV